MATHNAAGQMMGYLYQVRYAMLLLLESENPTFKISIEKFDDIAFEDGFSPVEMIQNKHHGSAGSLTDRSVDLWKTIKVWLDQTKDKPDLLNNCRFLIITTQTAGIGSAASMLKKESRDENKAIQILKEVAEEHGNAELQTVYDAFLNTDQKALSLIFKAVEIVDYAPNIVDLSDKIKKHIRLSCYPGYEENVMNQVEGWWFALAVKALSSTDHTMIDYTSLRNKIVSVGDQYRDDNLPIEEWSLEEISDEELVQYNRTFIQQLRLIEEGNAVLRRAIKNYYRAYQQRSSWAREELLLPNELEDYEKRLIDEWEQCKAFMDEDGDPVVQGKALYKEIMGKDIPIRKLCTEPFVMRGSYEMLADKKDIGWHREYMERLEMLLPV